MSRHKRFGAPRFDPDELRKFILPTGDDFSTGGNDSFFGGGGDGDGFGLNFKTFGAISSGLGGLGDLAKGFAAIKQLKLGRETLDFQKDAFNRNFAAQKRTINNRFRDQNAFKLAQSGGTRTDLAELIV